MMTDALPSRYLSPVAKTSTSMYLDKRIHDDLKWASETLGVSRATIVTLAIGEYVRKLRAERAPLPTAPPAPAPKRKR